MKLDQYKMIFYIWLTANLSSDHYLKLWERADKCFRTFICAT
jgi:hypothetical protein